MSKNDPESLGKKSKVVLSRTPKSAEIVAAGGVPPNNNYQPPSKEKGLAIASLTGALGSAGLVLRLALKAVSW